MSDTGSPAAKSPHAFMREALGVQARLREDRSMLVLAALRAEEAARESGTGYAADDVDRYFAARAAGMHAPAPVPGAWSKVTYSEAAFADLLRIYETLEADDPTLAANSVALIGTVVQDVGERPQLGRPAEEGLRERLISRGRTGYIALYRHLELDGCVLITAIRHRYAAGYPIAE